MIAAENPAVRVGLIRAVAWSGAVAQLRGTVPADDDLRLEWEGAGLITPEGEIVTDWARALRVTQDSVNGAQVVSTFDGVAFSATLFRLDDDLVCVTARATQDETGSIDAVHPLLEVALGPASDPWLLLRRVLPPLAELRADPRETGPGEAAPLSLNGVEIPEHLRSDPARGAAEVTQLPTLPAAVADAVDPRATVFAYTLRGDGGRAQQSNRAWALGKKDLYRVEPDTAQVLRVPAGDLGHLLSSALV